MLTEHKYIDGSAIYTLLRNHQVGLQSRWELSRLLKITIRQDNLAFEREFSNLIGHEIYQLILSIKTGNEGNSPPQPPLVALSPGVASVASFLSSFLKELINIHAVM